MLVCGYTEDGWHYWALVTGYTERDISLTFIDWGNTITIRDSLKVKEIPENFTNIKLVLSYLGSISFVTRHNRRLTEAAAKLNSITT